jgi:hypothetical protein
MKAPCVTALAYTLVNIKTGHFAHAFASTPSGVWYIAGIPVG